jgi:hypothetical protein
MFDESLDKEPQTFEESQENMEWLNRKMIIKLNEKGLDHKFEPIQLRRSSLMLGRQRLESYIKP